MNWIRGLIGATRRLEKIALQATSMMMVMMMMMMMTGGVCHQFVCRR